MDSILFVRSDDSQREVRFKQLENENERNKQMFTERIKQLQNEIDVLINEKRQTSIDTSK
jgi:hypothetical protein